MIRFIAHLLIISLLTMNIAWAVDECAFTDPSETSGMSVQADDKSPVNPSNTNFDCDDWCHTWANPVFLSGTLFLNDYIAITINGDFYTLSYSSLAIPPPFHPPIV